MQKRSKRKSNTPQHFSEGARVKMQIEPRPDPGGDPPADMVQREGLVWVARAKFEYVILHVQVGEFYGLHLYSKDGDRWTEYQSLSRYLDALGALTANGGAMNRIVLRGVMRGSIFFLYGEPRYEKIGNVDGTAIEAPRPEPDPLETFNRSLDDEKESVARVRQNMIDKRIREAHDKALAMGHAPGTFEIVNKNGVIHTVRKGATV